MKIPKVDELFETSSVSGPYAYVIRQMKRTRRNLRYSQVFRPWCGVRPGGEIDKKKLAKLLRAWSAEDAKCPFLVQVKPEVPGKPLKLFSTDAEPAPPPRVFGGVNDLPPENGWVRLPVAQSLRVYGGWHCSCDEDARLVAPLALGTDCEIRHGARLTWSLLGHRVHVAGRVSRSVIGDDTRIEPGAVIGDSLVGQRCLIGGSVIIRSDESLEGDRSEIVIKDRRGKRFQTIRTGRLVIGAVIGDGCRVFASLKPGTVLLPGCCVTQRMEGRLPAGIYSPEVLKEYDRILALREERDLHRAATRTSQRSKTRR